MTFITHYLYRNLGRGASLRHSPRRSASLSWDRLAVLLCALLMLSSGAMAQIRDRTQHDRVAPPEEQSKKPKKNGPRAIAVLEFLPAGKTRLVPVALWIDGRYQDASLYAADPIPMALQPGTMYQALNYGEPTGWFTVSTPLRLDGNWVAEGQWQPQGSLDTQVAQQAAKQPKPKPPSPFQEEDQGPPVLRRSDSSSSSAPSGSSGSPAPNAAGSPTQSPTGNASAASTPASGGKTPPKADDSDRPTLKAPAPDTSRPTLGGDESRPGTATSSPAPAPAPSRSPDENDPNRPTLQRGAPKPGPETSAAATAGSQPAATAGKSSAAAGAASSAAPAKAAVPQAGRAYPAISDAGDYETRSMLYNMTPAEQQEKAAPMLTLASEDIRKYAEQHKQEPQPTSALIADYTLRAFDLDFSNSPTLVLDAKLPVAKPGGGIFAYFATVVARLDIDGQPIKIFSSVTDSSHLDVYPRLEIIDAVEAEANGRGLLLFRQGSDVGVDYALYRVYPYQMTKVFEGGAGM